MIHSILQYTLGRDLDLVGPGLFVAAPGSAYLYLRRLYSVCPQQPQVVSFPVSRLHNLTQSCRTAFGEGGNKADVGAVVDQHIPSFARSRKASVTLKLPGTH